VGANVGGPELTYCYLRVTGISPEPATLSFLVWRSGFFHRIDPLCGVKGIYADGFDWRGVSEMAGVRSKAPP